MPEEIVTRVITFFFPYDSKVEGKNDCVDTYKIHTFPEYENSDWYRGDPRDHSNGQPNGHEMWGHGQIGWWQKDENGWHWYWEDESNMPRPTQGLSEIMSTTTTTGSPLSIVSWND